MRKMRKMIEEARRLAAQQDQQRNRSEHHLDHASGGGESFSSKMQRILHSDNVDPEFFSEAENRYRARRGIVNRFSSEQVQSQGGRF